MELSACTQMICDYPRFTCLGRKNFFQESHRARIGCPRALRTCSGLHTLLNRTRQRSRGRLSVSRPPKTRHPNRIYENLYN